MKKRILKIAKNLEGSSASGFHRALLTAALCMFPSIITPDYLMRQFSETCKKTALCNKRRFRCRSVYSLLASSLVISSQVTPFSTISTMA